MCGTFTCHFSNFASKEFCLEKLLKCHVSVSHDVAVHDQAVGHLADARPDLVRRPDVGERRHRAVDLLLALLDVRHTDPGPRIFFTAPRYARGAHGARGRARARTRLCISSSLRRFRLYQTARAQGSHCVALFSSCPMLAERNTGSRKNQGRALSGSARNRSSEGLSHDVRERASVLSSFCS